MRDDLLYKALDKIKSRNILINLVSRRVKQYRLGAKPLTSSLERLEPEDLALKEIIEDKISYELGDDSYSLS